MSASVTPLKSQPEPKTAFHRTELNAILSAYGRLVQAGEARDYAIGMYRDRAIFAIFRRHAEQATWRIEKVPALANRQGAWVVYGPQGQVLKRGHDATSVLGVFAGRRFRVIGD